MDEQNCISEQNWLKYSAGELNADEIRLLNSHCQNCEICSDIKEGIDAMKSPATLESQINNIKDKIDQKTKKRFIFLNVTTISIAASVLFGLLLFWFLFPSQNQLAIKPEIVNTQSESGVKSPENEIITAEKAIDIQQKSASKKQVIKSVPEPITIIQPENISSNDISMSESVSKDGAGLNENQVAPTQNQTESDDMNVSESKITQVPSVVNVPQNVSTKESTSKVSQASKKTKSLFEPSTKKTSIPSANNAISNNVFNEENIRNLNDFTPKDSSWMVLQQANRLFNELNYSGSLAICDSMLNFPKEAHFSKFVLLKTKILVSTSSKEKAEDFLKEQIKKYKIRDQILVDYLKILKE
ncbi:MAG: hypothetical protein ACOVO9_10560 [Bacteroidia bacterium]